MNDDLTIEPIVAPVQEMETQKKSNTAASAIIGEQQPLDTKKKYTAGAQTDTEREAIEIDLKQCYLCAKKHIARAQEFFQEYHTGYPDHIKNLVMSVRVAEQNVREAFLLWQRAMGQLNMGEGELLGKSANTLSLREEHISLATRIRAERIRLSNDPMYVPDFDQLLVDINILQYRVLEVAE